MTNADIKRLLPRKKSSSKVNPNGLVVTILAEPKWGKTTFFTGNDEALLLAFEEGHKFADGHKLVIDKWDANLKDKYRPKVDQDGIRHCTFMQALEALENDTRFNFVIIDTADMAAKMCADFYTKKKGIEHVSEGGDYGKGYDTLLNTPFRQAILRIVKTGRGVGFCCHSKIETSKFSGGEKSKQGFRISGGIKYIVESQSDLILHGIFGRKTKGKGRDRIVQTDGDQDLAAGNRCKVPLPDKYIVAPNRGWAQLTELLTQPEKVAVAEREYQKLYRK